MKPITAVIIEFAKDGWVPVSWKNIFDKLVKSATLTNAI